METTPIIMELTFNVPVAKVWQAITDRDQMAKWYFELKEFSAVPGFQCSFLAGSEGDMYLHFWEVTEVVSEKILAYTWCYDGDPGISLARFSLYPEGGKTKLIFTHSGIESFDPANAALAKKNFVAGWHQILDIQLQAFLDAGA